MHDLFGNVSNTITIIVGDKSLIIPEQDIVLPHDEGPFDVSGGMGDLYIGHHRHWKKVAMKKPRITLSEGEYIDVKTKVRLSRISPSQAERRLVPLLDG